MVGAWLRRMARPARPFLSLAVAAGIVNGVAVIAQSWLLARIVHGVAIDGLDREAVLEPLLLLLPVFVVRAAASWASEAAGQAAAARVIRRVRDTLVAHMAALGPAFVGGRHTGGLASVALEQTASLEGFVARYLPQMTLAAAVPAVIWLAVLWVSWPAAVILLVTAPLIPLFMALMGMRAGTLHRRHFAELERMSGHFLDRLSGLATLRLFGAAEREAVDIGTVADRFRRTTMSVLRVAFLTTAVLELFAALAVAGVAVYVGLSLLDLIGSGIEGGMTLEKGLFMLLLAPEFFLPLRQLGQHYHDRAAAVGAGDAILAILEQPVRARAAAGPEPAGPAPAPALALDAVHVAYEEGGRPALHGVSLAVAPGERVALVGDSGAGKSTVLGLILGLFPADRGTVLIDGRAPGGASAPGEGGDPPLLAGGGRVAWLGQRPALFHGTVTENVRLGRPEASEAELAAAIRIAGVDRFATALPDGLDTVIGSTGFGLSGGQARRVALARALLTDAPLVLLDEPTASLDREAAAAILDRLGPWLAGRTTLLATHDPTVAAICDRRVILRAGRVAVAGEAVAADG